METHVLTALCLFAVLILFLLYRRVRQMETAHELNNHTISLLIAEKTQITKDLSDRIDWLGQWVTKLIQADADLNQSLRVYVLSETEAGKALMVKSITSLDASISRTIEEIDTRLSDRADVLNTSLNALRDEFRGRKQQDREQSRRSQSWADQRTSAAAPALKAMAQLQDES